MDGSQIGVLNFASAYNPGGGFIQAEFTVNETQYQLDVSTQVINGSTMLPIRAVVEAVGYEFSWDSTIQTVVIITDNLWNFVDDSWQRQIRREFIWVLICTEKIDLWLRLMIRVF